MPVFYLQSACAASDCCLSLYLSVGGLQKGTGKFFWRSWKSDGIYFFVSKCVGTLFAVRLLFVLVKCMKCLNCSKRARGIRSKHQGDAVYNCTWVAPEWISRSQRDGFKTFIFVFLISKGHILSLS